MKLRIAWIAIALAAAQAVVGVALALGTYREGWVGGLLYVCLYAVPLLLLGLALRSPDHIVRLAAGWMALVLAIAYSVLVAVNWAGYSSAQAVLAVGVTLPTVAVDLVIFWAAVIGDAQSPSQRAAS